MIEIVEDTYWSTNSKTNLNMTEHTKFTYEAKLMNTHPWNIKMMKTILPKSDEKIKTNYQNWETSRQKENNNLPQ